MKLKRKDFLSLQEFNEEELMDLIDYVLDTKDNIPQLTNKSILNLLLTPSVHTRMVLETAIQQLGGRSIMMDFTTDKWELLWKDEDRALNPNSEHVKDAAKVLSNYCDAIAVQHAPYTGNWRIDRQDSVIKGIAQHSSVPVLNLESVLFNPCQALADMVTIKSSLKSLSGWKAVLTWAYQPDSQNNMSMANEFALAASKCGMELAIASPKGYELDPGILKLVEKNCRSHGEAAEFTDNLDDVIRGAHVVYAVNWRSIPNYSQEQENREGLEYWQITEDHMERTDGAYLMHPLPIRRGVSVTSGVLDGKNSIVYKQSQTRLLVQKLLLSMMVRR